MTNTKGKQSVTLATEDIALLLQSLDHCLATCTQKTAGKPGPCADCDRARTLRQQLASAIGAP